MFPEILNPKPWVATESPRLGGFSIGVKRLGSLDNNSQP